MKNILFMVGLILAVTNVQAQELPAGLSSKCECSNVKTSKFTSMEVVIPAGLYIKMPTQAFVWEKDNRLTVISLDGSETALPIAWSQTWGPQTRISFTDGGYAILTPSLQEGEWSMIRFYKTPPARSITGELYLTLYR